MIHERSKRDGGASMKTDDAGRRAGGIVANPPQPVCRKDAFSIPAGEHYLNCAYMSPLSKNVERAGIDGVRRKTEPWRIEPADFFDECHAVRRRFAALVGAESPERIAIVPSASYGFAQVARNTAVAKGGKIVVADEEFPSNFYIWRRLCDERGARLVAVGSPGDGPDRAARWNEAILEAIDARTAVVSVGQVAWTDGMRFDLEAIGRRARECGAALVVDGSQSVGAMPFDVREIRPDALVCPTYKWLMGPYSMGLVYFGERYDRGTPIEESWITRRGSEDFAALVNYVDAYRPGAIRYDVGETSNFALMPMVLAALDQVSEWTPKTISAYGRALTADLIAQLREDGFGLIDDDHRAGHLFGFRLPGAVDPEALRRRLRVERVHVSVRGDAVRVSSHLFNDAEDVSALARALRTKGVRP
jgi:selenocysteine lyase/cysteine desulfurase